MLKALQSGEGNKVTRPFRIKFLVNFIAVILRIWLISSSIQARMWLIQGLTSLQHNLSAGYFSNIPTKLYKQHSFSGHTYKVPVVIDTERFLHQHSFHSRHFTQKRFFFARAYQRNRQMFSLFQRKVGKSKIVKVRFLHPFSNAFYEHS